MMFDKIENKLSFWKLFSKFVNIQKLNNFFFMTSLRYNKLFNLFIEKILTFVVLDMLQIQ